MTPRVVRRYRPGSPDPVYEAPVSPAPPAVPCKGCRGREEWPAGWLAIPDPPPLNLTPRSRRAVVTLAVGAEGRRLHDASKDHQAAYARRLRADYVVLDWPGHPAWPMSAKFGIGRALDHHDRIAYLDADVLPRPDCVDLFDACRPHEMGIVDELQHHRQNPRFGREAAYQRFRREMGFRPTPDLPWMFNAGVMVVPKSHQHLLLPPESPMPTGHCAEQDHTNARLLDSGLPYWLLDRRCNWQNWTDHGFRAAPPDAVLHWSAGGDVRSRRAADMAACAARHPVPAFDPAAIAPFSDGWGWYTDRRHVRWLHGALMSGLFRRVLEIGCHHGYSTTAFLDAYLSRAVDEVHLCDLTPRPELAETVGRYDFVTPVPVHARPSVDLLAADGRWDLVFVDGDHSLGNVRREAELLLAAGVRCVFAHDTNAVNVPGHPGCDGPPALKEMFRAAGYHCLEDKEARPGERTDRGMFFAARDGAALEAGRRALIDTAGG